MLTLLQPSLRCWVMSVRSTASMLTMLVSALKTLFLRKDYCNCLFLSLVADYTLCCLSVVLTTQADSKKLEGLPIGWSKSNNMGFYFFLCFLVNCPLSNCKLTLLSVPFSFGRLSWENCWTACWMAVCTINLLAFCNFVSSCPVPDLSPVRKKDYFNWKLYINISISIT